MTSVRLRVGVALVTLVATGGTISLAADSELEPKYQAPVDRLEAAVQEELKLGIVSGISIALIDDQQIVYADGFGLADAERKIPASAQTVYRAGSISKLFTAIAAMQLVEQGKLDLDAPVQNFNPDFQIVVPFEDARPITLRQLMCHRSGMIRESPVGGYFDDGEPSVDGTIASVAQCVLVNPPNTKTRYSNVGPTVVGQTIEKVSGTSFEQHVQEHILGVVGMPSSGWRLREPLSEHMAAGYMRVAETGGEFHRLQAPQFELGTVPAGNLYTSVEDLARFVTFLLAEGGAGERRLLHADTLREMFRPQLTGESTGFGLGFSVGKYRGHTTAQHMGAVYGFTTSMVVLPSQKVGAVVFTNEDIAVGSVQRLMSAALDAVLEGKTGTKPPEKPTIVELQSQQLGQLAGNYESQSYWAEISLQGDKLKAVISGQPMDLAPTSETSFRASGRFVHDAPVTFDRDGDGKITAFTALRQHFQRVDSGEATRTPSSWNGFVGSYGPSFIPLIVSIRHGHLYAMTENEFDYRLTPLNRTVFRMPPGLYDDEHLVFEQDAQGNVHAVILANMTLARREN